MLDAYECCGWDLRLSVNRLSQGEDVYPSFLDLFQSLEKVITESAYSEEVKSNYSGDMYVVICLAVMFVTQFTLKDKDDRYITSLMLIVLFAVGLVVSLFVLVKGITSIPNNKYCQDPSFFYYVIFPLIALCVGEISYGLFLFFMDKKEKEKIAKEQREKELSPDGIKLTKEEK